MFSRGVTTLFGLGAAIVFTTAVVLAIAGASSRHQVSPLAMIAGGNFQASAVAGVPNSNQYLFVDDDSPGKVYVLEIDPDGRQTGHAVPIPVPASVTDPEGMTWDGRHFYIVGSQSKATGFEGDGLIRFMYDPDRRLISGVERIVALKQWLADRVPELYGTGNLIGDHVLNIEGMAWDWARHRLLLGLRAPVIGDSALIVPVQLADTSGPFSNDNLRLAGTTIRIPLGGAGIRSIEFDRSAQTYYVITGASLNEETLDFHVIRWTGESAAPTPVVTYDKSLKPEGVVTARVANRPVRVLVFDTGRMAVVE